MMHKLGQQVGRAPKHVPIVARQQLDMFKDSEKGEGTFGLFNYMTLKYIRRWIGTAAQQASTAKDEEETTTKTLLLKQLQVVVICNTWVLKASVQKGLDAFNKALRVLEYLMEQGPIRNFECDYWHEFVFTVHSQASGLGVLERSENGHLQTVFNDSFKNITDMHVKFLRLVCPNIMPRESQSEGAAVVLVDLVPFCDAIVEPSRMTQ